MGCPSYGGFTVDPNRFRLRKIIRIISLVYLFVKNCYSVCGLKGKFNKHPEVTIDPIPIPFSCKGEQYIVTTGSLDNGNPFRCPGGLVICVSNNEVRVAMTYLFRKGDHGNKRISKCAHITFHDGAY